MRYKVTIDKVIEIDTGKDWGGDYELLVEALKNNNVEGSPTLQECEEALESMFEDDMDSVLGDNGVELVDCKITVLDTVGVPDIESDDE